MLLPRLLKSLCLCAQSFRWKFALIRLWCDTFMSRFIFYLSHKIFVLEESTIVDHDIKLIFNCICLLLCSMWSSCVFAIVALKFTTKMSNNLGSLFHQTYAVRSKTLQISLEIWSVFFPRNRTVPTRTDILNNRVVHRVCRLLRCAIFHYPSLICEKMGILADLVWNPCY